MLRTNKRPRRHSTLHLPSSLDLLGLSRDMVLKNIWIFGPLYAVPLIFSIHSWIWEPLPSVPQHWWYKISGFAWGSSGSPLPLYFTQLLIGFSLLWLIIIIVGGTIIQIMSQQAQLMATDGKDLSFSQIWPAVKKYGWRLLGLYILTGFALVLTLFIGTRRYLLAPYVLIDKNTGIRQAMRQSSDISARNPAAV